MNFDKVIDRRGTYCTQWDYIEDRFGKGTKDLTPFSISDTDFKCPDEIIEAVLKRVKHGVFGYSRWNHDDFKNSIKEWYKTRYNTVIENEWIVYSPSVIYSIALLIEKLIGIGGNVMTHTPKYDGFTKVLSPFNVTEVKLIENSKGEYETNFIEIEEGFKKGVKVFLLCNPENPTGKIWKKDELRQLINLCNKYSVTLISDDIHMDIARKEVTPILKLDTKNCLIVSSASKTFNTPSLGGSYAIIPCEKIRKEFLYYTREIHAVSSPAILGVISTMTAYTKCSYWVDELNKYLTKNCEYVVKELNGFKGVKVSVPEATYLMWIDIKDTGIDPEVLKKAMVEIGKVAIMPGENYGDKYKIRLNVGCSLDKIKIGVQGIKKTIDYINS